MLLSEKVKTDDLVTESDGVTQRVDEMNDSVTDIEGGDLVSLSERGVSVTEQSDSSYRTGQGWLGGLI
jgi:hypothetical protein